MEDLKRAYEAGKDSAINGPTQKNCHFTLFSSQEMTSAWERGNRDGRRELEERLRQQPEVPGA